MVIFVMVIIDFIQVFTASFEVKSMIFYPTPLYILNRELKKETEPNPEEKVIQEEVVEPKTGTKDSFLEESQVWLNVKDKNLANIDKVLSREQEHHFKVTKQEDKI